MILGVSREQLQGLLDAAQLLEAARVPVEARAYLFARFQPEAHERLRCFFLPQIQAHFEGCTGAAEEIAAQMAVATPVTIAVVRARLTLESLHRILDGGLVLEHAWGIIGLGSRGYVLVRIHKGVQALLTPGSMLDLTLAHREESLEAYAFRIQHPPGLSL